MGQEVLELKKKRIKTQDLKMRMILELAVCIKKREKNEAQLRHTKSIITTEPCLLCIHKKRVFCSLHGVSGVKGRRY